MKSKLTKVLLIPFLVAGLVSLSLTGTQAQTLDERVKRLEKKMQDDDLASDPYVSEFGGRIMADWSFNTSQSDNYVSQLGDEAEDGFEFRRLRLYTEGGVAKDIEYKLQLDFADELAGNEVDIKDAYISVDKGLVGIPLKIGHFKEPFSLNELTSSKYITFMSRSMLSDGFTPEYNPGIQTAYHTPDNKFNLTLGMFNPQSGLQQPATSGSWNLSGRITSPIVYSNSGKNLVHLGLGFSQRSEQSGTYSSDLEPEVHKGDPEYLDITVPSVTSSTVFGLEAATVQGPLSIQAEYAQNDLSRSAGKEPTLSSQYLMASYLLTGEHRPYDKADGDFGRIDVNNSVNNGGSGAWELAARWSSTDYSDAQGPTTGDVDLASKANVITLGTNWYPTGHSKWMVNYVTANQDAKDVDAQWLTTRFQVDF
ncbi:MAG: OprO/OprP family phosphate-selective porin [bacterium]